MAAVKAYFHITTWEHHQVSAWTKALEPKSFEEQNVMYQDLHKDGKLKHFGQGDSGCHAGLALLINMAVNPHKDVYDVKDGWTATNCWGSFKGGDLVFPELQRKIRQEPGDLVLAHYSVLYQLCREY